MEKKEILEFFLKNGILLSPEEFDQINEKNYLEFFQRKKAETKREEIVVETQTKRKITNKEFVNISREKFDFLRNLLIQKTEAVSINKGKKLFSTITIIGRVKESGSKGFVVEDETGETEVIGENKDVNIGDVIALKGYFKDNVFYANQIIWPDIPLDHENLLDIRLTLTPKVKEDMIGFVICPKAKTEGRVIGGFSKYGKIKIMKDNKEIIIIAFSPSKEMSEEESIKILKKRIIPESSLLENIITEVPHIFWIFNNGRNWARNYKGVVIVSTDNESFAELHGHEVNFGKI